MPVVRRGPLEGVEPVEPQPDTVAPVEPQSDAVNQDISDEVVSDDDATRTIVKTPSVEAFVKVEPYGDEWSNTVHSLERAFSDASDRSSPSKVNAPDDIGAGVGPLEPEADQISNRGRAEGQAESEECAYERVLENQDDGSRLQ